MESGPGRGLIESRQPEREPEHRAISARPAAHVKFQFSIPGPVAEALASARLVRALPGPASGVGFSLVSEVESCLWPVKRVETRLRDRAS